MDRITKDNVRDQARYFNKRMRNGGSEAPGGRWLMVSFRNGSCALDEYQGNVWIDTLTVGTKREVMNFIHAMHVGLDFASRAKGGA